jgi:hypothetical protein
MGVITIQRAKKDVKLQKKLIKIKKYLYFVI